MNTERIKQLIEEKNITLYTLSKLTGIDRIGISRILNNYTKDPRISTVAKLALALEIDINELIDWTQYNIE